MNAERPEDLDDPRSVGDRHDGTGHRFTLGLVAADLLAHPGLFLGLLEQVGDADPVGSPDGDAGLDSCADVVRVDMAVPDAVAADDDDRIAEFSPGVLEARHGVVRCVEEEHDLVAAAVESEAGGLTVDGQRGGSHRDLGRLGQRSAVGDGQDGIEEEHVAAGAGVDDARFGQDGQQVGRPGQRVASPFPGRLSDRQQVGTHVGGDHRRLGRLADHREDRALDRLSDGAVGRLGGGGQSVSEDATVDVAGFVHHAAQCAQHLGQDHARVAPRPHERAVGHGAGHRSQVVVRGLELLERRDRRLGGHGHVRAGVAVRHRVHVEEVEHLPVVDQCVAEADHDGPQADGIQVGCYGHAASVAIPRRALAAPPDRTIDDRGQVPGSEGWSPPGGGRSLAEFPRAGTIAARPDHRRIQDRNGLRL